MHIARDLKLLSNYRNRLPPSIFRTKSIIITSIFSIFISIDLSSINFRYSTKPYLIIIIIIIIIIIQCSFYHYHLLTLINYFNQFLIHLYLDVMSDLTVLKIYPYLLIFPCNLNHHYYYYRSILFPSSFQINYQFIHLTVEAHLILFLNYSKLVVVLL